VNAEIGDNAFDGLSPTPGVAGSGPFKTVTRALQAIVQNPFIDGGPPYTVRIAARWYRGTTGQPYIYGNPPAGTPNPLAYTGETFPLRVPPRTLLMADAVNSEQDPSSGAAFPVIIEGPLYTSTTSAPVPAVNTIEFTAGQTDTDADGFTTEGGLDGTEIRPYGLEIRGGLRSVLVQADRKLPKQWGIPNSPPNISYLFPFMSIRIEQVRFSGRAGYNLDAHIEDGASGDFTVANCEFTTDLGPVDVQGTFPAPVHVNHTGQALIHVFSAEDANFQGGIPTLAPRFTENFLTVLPPPGGTTVPDVPWGMVIEPSRNSDSHVTVSSLTVDGKAVQSPPPPAPQEGIDVGLEYASNTGNPVSGGMALIPRFDLTASSFLKCAVFGAAVATGAVLPATITRIEIAGNTIDATGLRPWGDYASCGTHNAYRGSGLHLVSRHGSSWFIGSVANNVIRNNLTGIGLSQGSVAPLPGTIPPSEPQGLTIAGNGITNQVLSAPFPPGLPSSTGCGIPPFPSLADGVGIVLGDDFGYNSPGPGVLDATSILENNRVSGNARHGVWVREAGGSISPVLRNDRIWNNGTAAPSPPGTEDGVRIESSAGTGVLAPVLVNETIVLNANGFGVNNAGGVGTPVLWNSIVYDNNAAVTAAGPPKDLNGFSFPGPGATGGLVNFTDFCGAPWLSTDPACGTIDDPFAAHMCTSAPPQFEAPTATPANFQLICAGGGTPSPCSPPCYVAGTPGGGSRCIDRASPSAPSYLLLDATGAPRVGLVAATAVPDMGALEKQSCTP